MPDEPEPLASLLLRYRHDDRDSAGLARQEWSADRGVPAEIPRDEALDVLAAIPDRLVGQSNVAWTVAAAAPAPKRA